MKVRLEVFLSKQSIELLEAEAKRRNANPFYDRMPWTWKEVAAVEAQIAINRLAHGKQEREVTP